MWCLMPWAPDPIPSPCTHQPLSSGSGSIPLPTPLTPLSALAAVVSQWHQEPKDKVISLLLTHLPLLQPGNMDAKTEYMKLLQKVLAYSIESNLFIEESRQLLSYALIHPATTLDDRNSLALWLGHLEDRLSGAFSGQSRGRADPTYHSRQGSDEWQGPGEPGVGELGHGWQDKPPRENGHLPFHSSSSVPSAINSLGSNANAGTGAGEGRGSGGRAVRDLEVRCTPLVLCAVTVSSRIRHLSLGQRICRHSTCPTLGFEMQGIARRDLLSRS